MSSKYVGTVFIADEYTRYLRFPYSHRLINEVKTTFNNRDWDPENKQWVIALSGPLCTAKLNRFAARYGFIEERPQGTQAATDRVGSLATDLPWYE